MAGCFLMEDRCMLGDGRLLWTNVLLYISGEASCISIAVLISYMYFIITFVQRSRRRHRLHLHIDAMCGRFTVCSS